MAFKKKEEKKIVKEIKKAVAPKNDIPEGLRVSVPVVNIKQEGSE